jgi:AraC-like DNA-binding protein
MRVRTGEIRLTKNLPEPTCARPIAVITEHQPLLALAELFNCVEDALVWVKDREGRYCWVNRAFLMNFEMNNHQPSAGAGMEAIIGKTDYDLSPEFLADQFRLDDEYVLTGERIVNRIEMVGQPDGQTVWNVTDKVPLFDNEGSIIGTAGITRRLNAPGRDNATGSEFGPVLAYMRDHYHSPISNQQLARLAHTSVRAFERKFRGTFHLTPQKYLRKLRLRMASRALAYTSQALAELAVSCGFADQSHFTREFRRQFGRTPRDYREYYRQGASAAASGTKSAAGKQ